MTELALTGVTKSFGAVRVLSGVELEVADGELVVLLGPSGCGKTTLLRLVAGVESPDRGEVRLGERVVAGPGVHVPPEDRRVGIVFQDGALFDHLSVAENVGFGLPRGQRRRSPRIDELLELVGLPDAGGRRPEELSGGQRQRVALARALAPDPLVLLLDEPFSNLDATLRVQLRRQVRDILRAAGTTGVFVTHDRTEAFELADRVALIHDGVVAQVDRPEAVYRQPVDAWVAAFVGDGSLVAGESEGGRASTPVGTLELLAGSPEGPVEVLIRPEQLRIGGTGGSSGVDGVVVAVRFEGPTVRSTLEVGGVTVEAIEVDRPAGSGGHRRSRAVGDVVTVDLLGPFPAYPTRSVTSDGSPSHHDE